MTTITPTTALRLAADLLHGVDGDYVVHVHRHVEYDETYIHVQARDDGDRALVDRVAHVFGGEPHENLYNSPSAQMIGTYEASGTYCGISVRAWCPLVSRSCGRELDPEQALAIDAITSDAAETAVAS